MSAAESPHGDLTTAVVRKLHLKYLVPAAVPQQIDMD